MTRYTFPQYYLDADRELANRYPQYGMLSDEDRLLLLTSIDRDYVSNGHLGQTGIEIAGFIVMVVGILVSVGVTVYQIVKAEKSAAALSRTADQAAAIRAEAVTTSIQAQAITASTDAQEAKQKKNMLVTGGTLLTAAVLTIFLAT